MYTMTAGAGSFAGRKTFVGHRPSRVTTSTWDE
jgi:hypothetical protein